MYLTVGDAVGLAMMFVAIAMSAIGVIKAIKSKFCNLDGVIILCLVAVIIANLGLIIKRIL